MKVCTAGLIYMCFPVWTQDGKTAIIWATLNGHSKVVAFLEQVKLWAKLRVVSTTHVFAAHLLTSKLSTYPISHILIVSHTHTHTRNYLYAQVTRSSTHPVTHAQLSRIHSPGRSLTQTVT